MFRLPSRLAAVVAVAGVLLAAGAASASAHVGVDAPGATQGGYAVITFKVPNEQATASTVGLTVQLPTDTPLASVSVEAMPGWTWSAPEKTLATPITTDDGPVTDAVTEIVWTATAGGIAPGEFAEFRISAGPLPDQNTLVFKALQTYSDGTRVDWIETPAAGSTAEPEHPAPTLTLAAAAPSNGSSTGSDTSVSATSSGAPAADAASATSDGHGLATTGVVLGAIGVVLGAAALALGVRRGRVRVGDGS